MLWRLDPNGLGSHMGTYYNEPPVTKDYDYLVDLKNHVQIIYTNNIALDELLPILGLRKTEEDNFIVFDPIG